MQKLINFLKYIYYTYSLYIYVYKNFPAIFDEGLRNNKRDGEIGKHNLNEMGVLNMK